MPNGTNTAWEPWRVEKLRQMVAAGNSNREIGEAIGMSKGAIIGKKSRLGIVSPREVEQAKVLHRENYFRELARRDLQADVQQTFLGFQPQRLLLWELPDDACHWPLDETRDGCTLYCGNNVSKGKKYCDDHDNRRRR